MSDGWRVLITGIAGTLAATLARRLSDHHGVDRVIGIDTRLPVHDLRRTRIVRAPLSSPVVGELFERERIDTLVHLDITSTAGRSGGRAHMKERNVIGSMHLLAAAQRAPSLRTVVMRSSTAVYGSDADSQALFGEDTATHASSGYARDCLDAEGYARALARRNPGVVLTVLRFANFLGGGIDSSFARYLSLSVIPTVLGFDPRIQLCHTADAVDIAAQAALDAYPGIYNVAGPGVLYLSQATRIAGRPTAPIPHPLVEPLATMLRRTGRVEVPTDQLGYLSFGRVADISRMRRRFDFEPTYSTRATLETFLSEEGVAPLVTEPRWRDVQRRATDVARGVDALLR